MTVLISNSPVYNYSTANMVSIHKGKSSLIVVDVPFCIFNYSNEESLGCASFKLRTFKLMFWESIMTSRS